MNRKGDISITLLVIFVLIICVFAIGVFYINNLKLNKHLIVESLIGQIVAKEHYIRASLNLGKQPEEINIENVVWNGQEYVIEESIKKTTGWIPFFKKTSDILKVRYVVDFEN